MVRRVLIAVSLLWSCAVLAQAPVARPKFDTFEVATVKPVDADVHAGRMFNMDGERRWKAMNFTLKNLIALAYDLNPRTISGGPGWMDEQHFDIEAVTPGNVKPTR